MSIPELAEQESPAHQAVVRPSPSGRGKRAPEIVNSYCDIQDHAIFREGDDPTETVRRLGAQMLTS